MYLYFQNKSIQLTLTNMLPFDKNMIKAKKYYLKIQPSIKWTNCECIPLQNQLNEHNCKSLRHMDKKMVVDNVNNIQISQVQVGYIFYPVMNKNRVFKDQEKNELNIRQTNNGSYKKVFI